MIRAGGGSFAACASRLVTAPSEVLIASPIAVPCTPVMPSASRSMPVVERVPVGAGRHQHRGAAGERDQPDVELVGQPVDEAPGGLLGGGQPVRFDVGGEHRRGDVHRDHHGGPLPGHPDLGGGPGEADHQQRQHGQEEPGRHVPAPGRPLRRDPVEQPQVGEADRVPAAPALHQQVRDDQREHAEQQPEPQSGDCQITRHLPGRGRPARAASRRWACTCRTMSALQSRSVRSGRWVAPLRRSAWRTCSRWAAAASAYRSRSRAVPVRTPRAAGRSPGRPA